MDSDSEIVRWTETVNCQMDSDSEIVGWTVTVR